MVSGRPSSRARNDRRSARRPAPASPTTAVSPVPANHAPTPHRAASRRQRGPQRECPLAVPGGRCAAGRASSCTRSCPSTWSAVIGARRATSRRRPGPSRGRDRPRAPAVRRPPYESRSTCVPGSSPGREQRPLRRHVGQRLRPDVAHRRARPAPPCRAAPASRSGACSTRVARTTGSCVVPAPAGPAAEPVVPGEQVRGPGGEDDLACCQGLPVEVDDPAVAPVETDHLRTPCAPRPRPRSRPRPARSAGGASRRGSRPREPRPSRPRAGA